MASDYSKPLWSVHLRKEALDIMTLVWGLLDEVSREHLVKVIVAGSPQETANAKSEEEEEQQRWRDRQVYERLMLIDRLGQTQE